MEILPVDQLRIQDLGGLDPALVEGEALQGATACSQLMGLMAAKFSMYVSLPGSKVSFLIPSRACRSPPRPWPPAGIGWASPAPVHRRGRGNGIGLVQDQFQLLADRLLADSRGDDPRFAKSLAIWSTSFRACTGVITPLRFGSGPPWPRLVVNIIAASVSTTKMHAAAAAVRAILMASSSIRSVVRLGGNPGASPGPWLIPEYCAGRDA